MIKTYEDRIAQVKQKIEQEQNRMKRLIQEQKTAERKARTKRLIERGAIVESLIDDAETLSNDDIKLLLQNALSSTTAAQESPNNVEQQHNRDSLV